MLSAIYLIFFIRVIVSQTDICGLSEDSVANLKTVFSFGTHIYLGNDLFYPMSVDPIEAKPNLTIGQLFPGE